MRKFLLPLFAGAIIISGVLLLQAFNKEPASPASTPNPSNVDKTSKAHEPKLIIGSSSAPITITEYGDFQCPICKQFFEQTEPELIKEYVDTGRVKIEYRVETHIGHESLRAAEAVYCANDQAKFKPYHDMLYQHQGPADSGAFSDSNLKQFAKQIGLKPKVFNKCLDSGKYRQLVERSNKEADQRISSTPTFFIDGQKIVGAQPLSIFKTVIEASR